MTSMPWIEIKHATADALAIAVARRLSSSIDAALAERGQATIALAGGRTTPPILRRIAGESRDWSKLSILPTDERWVAADHPDNNLHQLQHSFAADHAIRWIALVPDKPRGKVNAVFANSALESIGEAFDVCLLGMGADGHFASLFPGASNLSGALDLASRESAVAVIPDPMPSAGPHPRISLTLARLLHSRHVILAISGADKRATLNRAIDGNDPGNLPVAALLHAPGRTIEIHWSP